MSCTSSLGQICHKLNPGGYVTFEANIQDESPDSSLQLQWSVDPPLPTVKYGNLLRVLPSSLLTDTPLIQVNVSASNSTHNGGASVDLLMNTPPQNGSIIVDPPYW